MLDSAGMVYFRFNFGSIASKTACFIGFCYFLYLGLKILKKFNIRV